MTSEKKPQAPVDAPNPPVPPPLLFLVFFLTGYALQQFVPVTILPLGWNLIPAVLLTLGGVFILAGALIALRRGRTAVSPFRPAKKLLTTGPYLRTRNPIYLAFAWIYLGFACWTASLWPFLLFPVLIITANRFVIAREEAHLERRFGDEWRAYRSRVRRWM